MKTWILFLSLVMSGMLWAQDVDTDQMSANQKRKAVVRSYIVLGLQELIKLRTMESSEEQRAHKLREALKEIKEHFNQNKLWIAEQLVGNLSREQRALLKIPEGTTLPEPSPMAGQEGGWDFEDSLVHFKLDSFRHYLWFYVELRLSEMAKPGAKIPELQSIFQEVENWIKDMEKANAQ